MAKKVAVGDMHQNPDESEVKAWIFDDWNRLNRLQGEPRRLKVEGVKHGDRWMIWQPLATASVCKQEVSAFWSRQEFDLALSNVRGKCWLGNCDGCYLKSEANLAALAREFPDRHDWWENMETLAANLKALSAAYWSKRYTRRELRGFIDRQGDWIFSTEGTLCQASDGECFV